MTISDFIVVISILVVIITIGFSNNKQLWLYKFGIREAIFLLLCLLVINILIIRHSEIIKVPTYETVRDRILGYKCMYFSYRTFRTDGLAYLLTLIMLITFIYYMGWGKHFPAKNHDKIIRYYKSLIDNNLPMLIDDLYYYHGNDIKEQLEKINKVCEKEDWDFKLAMEEEEEIKKANRRAARQRNITLKVMSKILMDKTFIQKSIDADPLFCLQFYSCLTTTRYYDDRIEFYFTKLIESKRSEFINELVDIDFYDTATTFDEKLNDTQFLKLFFNKNCTATLFRTNYLFGEAALREIHSGCEIFGKEESEWLENDYEKTICYQFVRYYSISSLYIQQDYVKDKKVRPYKDIYGEYLDYLTEGMSKNYGSFGEKTFAQRFIKDITGLKSNHL